MSVNCTCLLLKVFKWLSCCNKLSRKRSLKEKGFILASNFKVHPNHDGKFVTQDFERSGPVLSTVRNWRRTNTIEFLCIVYFLPFVNSRPQAWWLMPSVFSVVHPTSINLVNITLLSHSQKLHYPSQVCLETYLLVINC